ncbi:MAG: hypothetical protein ABSE49_10175 [Polyangiaceae bacterium]
MSIRTIAFPLHFFLGAVALTGALAFGAACSSSSAGSSSGGSSGSSTSSSGGGSGSSSGGGSGSSSGGEDGGAADPFVGTWVCSGTETNTYTQPAGKAATTDAYTDDVTITSNGDGTQTASSLPADGGASPCVTKSTVSGDTSTLETGTTCMNANGTTTTWTGGSATLTSSTTFMANRTYTFSGSVTYTPDGGSPTQVQVAGSGMSSGTCTKQ